MTSYLCILNKLLGKKLFLQELFMWHKIKLLLFLIFYCFMSKNIFKISTTSCTYYLLKFVKYY